MSKGVHSVVKCVAKCVAEYFKLLITNKLIGLSDCVIMAFKCGQNILDFYHS